VTTETIAKAITIKLVQAISPLRLALRRMDQQLQQCQASVDFVSGASTSFRERIAVLESRAPVPGPPGADGQPGRDGLGFDELTAEFDGERTLVLHFVKDGQTKDVACQLPIPLYQGTYQPGQPYQKGDLVTWGGSMWHCQADTITGPADHTPDWRLAVKRGRDGKDGKAA